MAGFCVDALLYVLSCAIHLTLSTPARRATHVTILCASMAEIGPMTDLVLWIHVGLMTIPAASGLGCSLRIGPGAVGLSIELRIPPSWRFRLWFSERAAASI